MKVLVYIQQMAQVRVTNAGQVISVTRSKQKGTCHLIYDNA